MAPCFAISPSVEILDSLSGISTEEWDVLAGDDVLACHRWLLSLIEASPGDGPPRRYVVVNDAAGLVAGWEIEVDNQGGSQGSVDELIYGEARRTALRVGLGLAPALVVRKRVCRPGLEPEEQRVVNRRLLDAVTELAREQRATVCFRQVTEREAVLFDQLQAAGYASSRELPVASLDILPEWRSFADYRRHLKPRHPGMENSIRNERNMGARAGLEIREVRDSALFPRFRQLLDAHSQRLNGQSCRVSAGIFERSVANLGGRVSFFAGLLEGEVAGVLIAVRSAGVEAYPVIGIDQSERTKRAALYFNLTYNANIHRGIEAGLRRLHYGILAYDTKIRRGCRLTSSVLMVRHENAMLRQIFPPLLRVRSGRLERKFDLDRFHRVSEH